MRRAFAAWILLAGGALAQVDGERLYRSYCAGCHGAKGEGGRGAMLAVERLTRAPDEESLVRVIAQGIPGTEMPESFLEEEEIRALAVWVRSLARKEAMPQAGEAARGRQLYLGKGNCTRCHALSGQGGTLGPDLTEIGTRRSAGYLRRALVEPEADVAESFSQYRWTINLPDNFLQVRLLTRDGRKITGARLNEDAFSIQVRDPDGRIHSFFKDELRELHKDRGRSPMPGFRDVFTAAELDDVVSFLASLRGAR